MPCTLLHIVEQPDPAPYRDVDLKDLVGDLPSFYCAHCTPLRALTASEASQCLDRDGPCWKPVDRICES